MPPSPSCCCLLLLRFWSICAFSVPSATSGGISCFRYRLVEHTDQLQQWRHVREGPKLVPPPHLFCIPAPGGNICLVVDERGAFHALRDACPPLGVPLSQTAVVDSQVGAIGDSFLGTRFDLIDGTVRGPWCPGGGSAGPLLLRLARRRQYHRLARAIMAICEITSRWMPHHLFRPTRRKGRQARSSGMRTPLFRPRPHERQQQRKLFSVDRSATALEVFPVTEESDGSLTIALPRFTTPGEESGDSTPWAAHCGLAGYPY